MDGCVATKLRRETLGQGIGLPQRGSVPHPQQISGPNTKDKCLDIGMRFRRVRTLHMNVSNCVWFCMVSELLCRLWPLPKTYIMHVKNSYTLVACADLLFTLFRNLDYKLQQ